MVGQFIGEIRLFTYNWAPRGWAMCDGQALKCDDNQALYKAIQNTYGGELGKTFCLPDLRGRVPLCAGDKEGMSICMAGQKGGEYQAGVSIRQIPEHTHTMNVTKDTPTERDPEGHYPAKHKDENRGKVYVEEPTLDGIFDSHAVTMSGSGVKHENMQPFLTVNFCIALAGDTP